MSSEQIKAVIQMVVTLVVTVGSIFGYEMAEDQAQQIAIVIVAVVVIAYSVWKNCNFTHAAEQGQRVLDAVKSIQKDTGEKLTAEAALELTDGQDDNQ